MNKALRLGAGIETTVCQMMWAEIKLEGNGSIYIHVA